MIHDTSKTPGNICNVCCTKIERFGVKIGRAEILRDVNLHIHCGELTALIGPNGAGKSTLLKAILGELKHSGDLHFLDAKGKRTGHPLIGYVPQHLNVDVGMPASVLDLFLASQTRIPIWLSGCPNRRSLVHKSLSRVQAEHLIDRRLGALSGGELQRVLLALALDPIPDLLLLDEPLSNTDQRGMELFYDTVSALRKNFDLSIILVSHDLHLVANYADRIVLLNQTVECCGTPEEMFNDDKVRQTFGNGNLAKTKRKAE